MNAPSVPVALRREIEQTLVPVRPLRPPWRRALLLMPVGLALLVGLPATLGLRADATRLGETLSWGLSAAQLGIGLLLVGGAMREAVPGLRLSTPALALLLGGSLLSVVCITLVTAMGSPTRVPAGQEGVFWAICFGSPVLLGVPALLLAGLLAARALPLRPEVAGALYGMGSGLLVDSGWRLFCHVSDPAHVLEAHGASVIALAALGALTARLWERVYGRASRYSSRGSLTLPPTSS